MGSVRYTLLKLRIVWIFVMHLAMNVVSDAGRKSYKMQLDNATKWGRYFLFSWFVSSQNTDFFLIRFFLKRIVIALIISRPAFRGARHLATVGAISSAAGTSFSRNPTHFSTHSQSPTHSSSIFFRIHSVSLSRIVVCVETHNCASLHLPHWDAQLCVSTSPALTRTMVRLYISRIEKHNCSSLPCSAKRIRFAVLCCCVSQHAMFCEAYSLHSIMLLRFATRQDGYKP
jgi:hypothetical protein